MSIVWRLSGKIGASRRFPEVEPSRRPKADPVNRLLASMFGLGTLCCVVPLFGVVARGCKGGDGDAARSAVRCACIYAVMTIASEARPMTPAGYPAGRGLVPERKRPDGIGLTQALGACVAPDYSLSARFVSASR